MSGLTNSVNALTNAVTGHLSKGKAGQGTGGEDLDEVLANLLADAGDAGDSPVAAKVWRVGAAADVKAAAPQPDDMKHDDGNATSRVVGMHHMIAIRRRLNDRLTDSIRNASTCAGVYHDSLTFSDLVLECTMEHFGSSEEEARAFLSSDINQPRKQWGGASKGRSASSSSEDGSGQKQQADPTVVRADTLLYAVQPHLVEAIKKKVITAFFSAVALDIQTVTLIQVLQWLAKNKYSDSEVGRKAVRAGVKAMFLYLGVTNREHDDDVGSGTVLGLSIGHYALASSFIRHCLELAMAKAYNKRTRRTGAEPGLYLHWRLELLSVDPFLERGNDAHFGLALPDGHRDDRIALQTAENEMVDHLQKKQEDNEQTYVRMLERLLAERQRLQAQRANSA